MKTIYVTITGTDFCCGLDFFRRHDALILKKEPKNEWDREAIAVYREGLGKVGYVANSPKTVLGESYSAGRLYDKIGKKGTRQMPCRVPKRRFSCGAPQHLTKNRKKDRCRN